MMRLSLFLTLTLCFVADAQDKEPKPPKKIMSVEGITEYRYDNGLKLLLFPDKSTSRVTVNMTVLVGSRHEGYGETGMAHLLEHMLFKGTPTHPDVPKTLRDVGAQFNGTTWVDRTNYYESMNASDKNLEIAIRLEADRLMNSNVKREDLASEMTVVRSEFERGENNPENILSQRMTAVAFEWHNYGKSTIGNRTDIERVPIERLREFYRKYYQPDNVVLVIAGNFDIAKAISLTSKYFGLLPRPKRKLVKTYTTEPAQDGEREVTLRRVGKVGATGVLYHTPAAAHPDFAPLQVLAVMVDVEPNGQVYTALVKSKKASSISTSILGLYDPGMLEILASVEDVEKLADARETLIKVMENLHTTKITKEEVDRAKKKLLKNREMLMTDPNRVGRTLSEWVSKGDWRLFFLHRDRLEKVTPEDVTRVAKTYLKRTNRTVGTYIPTEKRQRTNIPEAPELAKLLKDYKGRKAVAAGEVFDPTPENIEKRVKRSELPSGVKVALLPKKNRGETVVVSLNLRFGNENSLRGKVSAAEFLGTMMRRGTEDYSRQKLEDELDNLKASLSVASDAGELTCSIRCKRENLAAVLTLLEKVLRTPSFPEKEFEILKRQSIEGLQRGLTEPLQLSQRKLVRTIRPADKNDVRYAPTIAEEIKMVEDTTLDDVKKVYKEQLGGQTGELVVVGDFDPEAVKAQVAAILKDWKSDTPFKRIDRKADLSVKGQLETILTPDKANAVYIAAHTLAMSDSDPDYAAMQIGNFLLGAAPLASRLSTRVRGKDGLSYTVGSMFTASAKDEYGMVMIFAICNPANIKKVEKAITEEVAKVLKDGLTETELEQGKKAYLARLKVQRGTDGALAGQLSDGLYLGRTFEHQAKLEKKIASLTLAEVNAALKKHINPKRLVIVEAGDFKPKKK